MICSTYIPTYLPGGGGGGAKVLGTLSVPGRPTNLDNSRAWTHCACSMCGIFSVFLFFFFFFLTFFSRLSFLFSFSLSLGDGPI